MYAKNCRNRPVYVKIIASQRWDVFWRHSVVVHYWADLQSVYGFRCYDSIVPNATNAKCQRVLALAVCLVLLAPPMWISLYDAVFKVGVSEARVKDLPLLQGHRKINGFIQTLGQNSC